MNLLARKGIAISGRILLQHSRRGRSTQLTVMTAIIPEAAPLAFWRVNTFGERLGFQPVGLIPALVDCRSKLQNPDAASRSTRSRPGLDRATNLGSGSPGMIGNHVLFSKVPGAFIAQCPSPEGEGIRPSPSGTLREAGKEKCQEPFLHRGAGRGHGGLGLGGAQGGA
jgi:hypothetical protein